MDIRTRSSEGGGMTAEITSSRYLDILRLFKERRRKAVDQLAHDDEFTSAAQLADIQLVISAIEAVIAEEGTGGPSVYQTRGFTEI